MLLSQASFCSYSHTFMCLPSIMIFQAKLLYSHSYSHSYTVTPIRPLLYGHSYSHSRTITPIVTTIQSLLQATPIQSFL